MTSTFFPVVTRWELRSDILPLCYEEMSSDGRLDREGIAMWAGVRGEDQTAHIEAVILLRGPGIQRHRHVIRITSDLMNDVTDALDAHGLSLIGQIHAHPPDSPATLSPTDIKYGIAVPYYLSVVAPNYASSNEPAMAECGAHVYEPSIGWRLFGGAEANDRIRISHLSGSRVITVGSDE